MHEPSPLSPLEIKAMQESVNANDENTRKIVTMTVNGKYQQEIAYAIGKTREYVRQYVEGLGMYSTWRYAIENRISARTKERISLLSLLKSRISQVVNDPSLTWAERKAYEYALSTYNGLHKNAYPLKKLKKLFILYRKAIVQGKKLSLGTLAKRSGFPHPSTISRIFSKINIAPMVRNLEFKHMSKEKSQAIKNTAKLGYLMQNDIVTLSHLSLTTIINHAGNFFKDKRKSIKWFHAEKGFGLLGNLSYALASQIYEAQDLKFTPKEI